MVLVNLKNNKNPSYFLSTIDNPEIHNNSYKYPAFQGITVQRSRCEQMTPKGLSRDPYRGMSATPKRAPAPSERPVFRPKASQGRPGGEKAPYSSLIPKGKGKNPSNSKGFRRAFTTLPRRKKAFLVVLLMLIALFSYAGVQLYADEMAERTEFELVMLRILGGGENYLDVELELNIDNPSHFRIQTKWDLIDVYYDNESAGYLELPSFNLRQGHNNVFFATRMTDSGEGRLEVLAERMIAGDVAQLGLKGTISTRKPIGLELDIEKELPLGGLGEMSIEVHHIALDLTNNTGIDANVRLTVFNPSRIEVALDQLAFDVIYNNQTLTTFDPQGFMRRGENLMEMDIHVPAEQDDIYNPLAQSLIDGEPVDFHIRTNTSGNNLLTRIAATYSHDHAMGVGGTDGGSGFNTSVTGISVDSIGLFQSRVRIGALLENPGTLSTDLAPMVFSVYYQGSKVGVLDLDQTRIRPGLNALGMSMGVSTLSLNTIALLAKLTTGQSIDLVIVGQRVFSSSHQLIFQLPITVNEGTPGLI